MNNGVRLPNECTHAKLEKVLPITSKDIHHFINENEKDSEKLKTPFRSICKHCSVGFKIGLTIFRRSGTLTIEPCMRIESVNAWI